MNFIYQDFKKSGINKDVIDKYICKGYLIETDEYWQLFYPELYKNKPTAYCNKRLKNPAPDKGKYIKPKGQPSRLFRPLHFSPEKLKKPDEYVIITEGDKKAIKAVQEGFNCLSLGGVWAWKQTVKGENASGNEDDMLCADIIPDIANADFQNKMVYLCYDNDMWSKPQVKRALYHFAAYLVSEKEAVVKIIVLPEGNAKGLDDYLVKYGKAKFQELMDNADILTLRNIQDTLSGNFQRKIVFPIDIFSKPVGQSVLDLHKRLDAPIEYIACTFLVTASMIMDGHFAININPASNWIEYPILWCALVGTPSQKKTPCLKIGKSIIDEFEKALYHSFELDMQKYNTDLNMYKRSLAKYKKDLKEDKQAKIPQESEKPLKPRLTTQNATVEALSYAIYANESVGFGVGIYTDELAHFYKGLNQYKRGGNDAEYFLQSWNKNRQNILRKNNNTDFTVEASHNIIGSIQPKVLNDTLFASGVESYNGMIERWLFCCTEYMETGKLPLIKAEYDLSEFQSRCEKIFIKGFNLKCSTKIYDLEEEAQKIFLQYFQKVSDIKKSNKRGDLFKTYIQKQTNYVARFALILHGLEYLEEDKISADTIKSAIKLSLYFLNCFTKITNEHINSNQLETCTINNLLSRGIKQISPTTLYKSNYSRYKTKEHAKIVLESLANKGFGRLVKTKNGGFNFIAYGI